MQAQIQQAPVVMDEGNSNNPATMVAEHHQHQHPHQHQHHQHHQLHHQHQHQHHQVQPPQQHHHGILGPAEHRPMVIDQGGGHLGLPEDEDEDEDEEEEEPNVGASGSSAMEDHMGTPGALAMPGAAGAGGSGSPGMLLGTAGRQRPRPATSPGHMQMPVLPVPCCRVEGCGEDLSTAGDYHRRHKVCKTHATSPKVINHGQEQRFCQQCSRFHALSEFDEGKRSCRKRLAGHNERRRRHQPDSLATTSSDSPPLPPGREGSKKPRDMKNRGRGGRRGRTVGLSFSPRDETLMLRAAAEEMSSKRRKPGDESFYNDAYAERSKGRERGLRLAGEYNKENDDLDIDIADMEQVKEGLDLGEGIIIPPLPMNKDGKISMLKCWPQEENAEEMQQALEQLRPPRDDSEKKAWQKDDKEALLHCFWECPKVQPVWRWVGRQLSKLRGSKVRLDMKQAVFGANLDSLTSQETISVWKLLRSIILFQIWLARKGKVVSGIQWSSNKVIRGAWVDLMMYAMQDWVEVIKKKEAGKQEDAFELRGKFDNKWLVNQFAGRRSEWTMMWAEADDVLLE